MRTIVPIPALMKSALSAIMILSGFLFPLRASSAETHEMDISIAFDRANKLLKGNVTIAFHGDGEALIHTGDLVITSLKHNDHSLEPSVKDGMMRIKTENHSLISLSYECSSQENGPCVISEKGVVLTGNWYPSVEGMAFYKLKALVPEDFSAISEAEEIEIEKGPHGNLFSFRFPHPADSITFVAGRFTIKKETFNRVDLYAYFLPEDAGLADTYLEYTKKYLALYEKMLGPYPFRRFSVVENFLPTGYSFPTFTLLGQDVVRLPFIVRTSLGHEILHQWFGNSVYVDSEKGNWSEGLTTYLSDHLYEEQEGRGWQYRKQMLLDYESYVTPEKEQPLKDFQSRKDFASKAIGYGKSAMVFHMLRKTVGDGPFHTSLKTFVERKNFQRASWGDLQAVFESVSGRQLDWFFAQWVKEKGNPRFEVINQKVFPRGMDSVVSFDVIQKETVYTLDLPITITSDRGESRQTIRINDKKQHVEIPVPGNAEKMVIDEDYDIFRTLLPGETPPIIAKVFGDEKGILLLPAETKEIIRYSEAIRFFEDHHYSVKESATLTDEELKASSVVVLGQDHPILRRLFGSNDVPSEGFVFTVRKNPLNSSKAMAIINTSSEDETKASMKKLSHYGKYSTVAFSNGINTAKQVNESQRGWNILLREPISGVETTTTVTLNDIVNKIADKKIVYVGEQHDKYEHHLAQLEIIKGLYKKNSQLAIGMEMFQRPSQKALDDYIEGRIEEREFLKSSEYFKIWGLDYHYYRDILQFARDEKIPVVALNIRKEIVNKVSKNGMDSLSREEKKELPDSMDMTDEGYRERLKEVFHGHEGGEGRSFDQFYQSQIIWDEIMAQSIDEYLRKNPDRRMVVIVGGGHLAFSSGIPKRTFRRNRLDYAVVLNAETVEKGIADFVLFPEPVKITPAPKLMVVLKEDEGKVKIIGFSEESISEKAGLRNEDVIVSLDGTEIHTVEDIKIVLFYKKPGDVMKVKVLRKRLFFGEREMLFDVTL
jgi:aminopeptidase N